MKARFVIHEHHATNLHLAIAVPDHSVGYINYEGTISEGNYGAGAGVIWDNGAFETNNEAAAQLEKGRLNFTFHGAKLRGAFSLVEMKNRNGQWLIIKTADEFSDANWKLQTVSPPKAKKKV